MSVCLIVTPRSVFFTRLICHSWNRFLFSPYGVHCAPKCLDTLRQLCRSIIRLTKNRSVLSLITWQLWLISCVCDRWNALQTAVIANRTYLPLICNAAKQQQIRFQCGGIDLLKLVKVTFRAHFGWEFLFLFIQRGKMEPSHHEQHHGCVGFQLIICTLYAIFLFPCNTVNGIDALHHCSSMSPLIHQ